MANIKLSFLGTEMSHSSDHELKFFHNTENEIFINIQMEDLPPSWICLDRSTAIKFAKTLRTEINKMEDINNG